LGRKRRLVLLLAWETLLPTIGFFPVTSHSRDTADSLKVPEFGKDREYSEKNANIQ
jgi:hypothetical protein